MGCSVWNCEDLSDRELEEVLNKELQNFYSSPDINTVLVGKSVGKDRLQDLDIDGGMSQESRIRTNRLLFFYMTRSV
jgi:hypothetical protein